MEEGRTEKTSGTMLGCVAVRLPLGNAIRSSTFAYEIRNNCKGHREVRLSTILGKLCGSRHILSRCQVMPRFWCRHFCMCLGSSLCAQPQGPCNTKLEKFARCHRALATKFYVPATVMQVVHGDVAYMCLNYISTSCTWPCLTWLSRRNLHGEPKNSFDQARLPLAAVARAATAL